MMENNSRPEEIAEHFGKLRLCHQIIYSLYLSLKDDKPEYVVLGDVSRTISEAVREIDGFIDRLLNPNNYIDE